MFGRINFIIPILFLPLYWLSVIFPPDMDGRVKSGARSPDLTFSSLSTGFSFPKSTNLDFDGEDSLKAGGIAKHKLTATPTIILRFNFIYITPMFSPL